jgi:hypothetical protein
MERFLMRYTTKVLLALAACAGFAANAHAELTAAWTISPIDDRAWYTLASIAGNSRTVRGVTYSATADKLYIISRTPSPGIVQINPADGTDFAAHVAFVAPVSGGTFTANMIDVDDDATAQVIYFSNLTVNVTSTAFKIYRMTDPANVAGVTEAFNGTINTIGTNPRLGDTLAVTGSGTGTEIYAGTNIFGATNASLVIFTTTDGLTFTHTGQKFFSAESAARARLGLSVEGTGANAIIWGNTSGQLPVLISATADSLTPASFLGDPSNAAPNNLTTIGVKTIGGTTYVGLGIGNPATSNVASAPLNIANVDRHALYTATGADLTLVDRTAPVTNLTADTNDDPTFIYPNGDGTGSVTFDTTRNRVVFLSTNQTIGSYTIPATNVSDWNLF